MGQNESPLGLGCNEGLGVFGKGKQGVNSFDSNLSLVLTGGSGYMFPVAEKSQDGFFHISAFGRLRSAVFILTVAVGVPGIAEGTLPIHREVVLEASYSYGMSNIGFFQRFPEYVEPCVIQGLDFYKNLRECRDEISGDGMPRVYFGDGSQVIELPVDGFQGNYRI